MSVSSEITEVDLDCVNMKAEATTPAVGQDVEPTGPGNVVVIDNAPSVDIITRMTNLPVVCSTIGQVRPSLWSLLLTQSSQSICPEHMELN